jgi:hypothetical protein
MAGHGNCRRFIRELPFPWPWNFDQTYDSGWATVPKIIAAALTRLTKRVKIVLVVRAWTEDDPAGRPGPSRLRRNPTLEAPLALTPIPHDHADLAGSLMRHKVFRFAGRIGSTPP